MREPVFLVLAGLLPLALLFFACNPDIDEDGDGTVMPPMPVCDTALGPIIFIHGALGSGDTWAPQVQRFLANEACADRLYAFDWNSIDQDDAPDLAALDALVDTVRARTGAGQVNLAGHSAGGRLSYTYMSDPERAAKVALYAHIGSFRIDSLPGPPNAKIPTANIWSPDDTVIDDKGDISGATNSSFAGQDHYQIATSPETFEAIYEHFRGRMPASLDPEPSDPVEISGRVVDLGENTPQEGATVEVYALDATTGNRLSGNPDAAFTIDATGNWGPLEVDANTPYEFFVTPADPDNRPVHYYREGFTASNPLVYLRTLPGPGSTAGLLLSALPRDDNQTVLALFASSQAVIHGRDQLLVDSLELSTEELAPAEATNIAFFLYDDGDQSTSGAVHGLFNLAPFLTGVDVFIPTAPPTSVSITFNGRTLAVPNLRSETDGVIVAVFD